MDAFNKRIGRPSAAAPYVRAANLAPAPAQAPALPVQSAPQAVQAPRLAQLPKLAQPAPIPAPAAASASASVPYSNVSRQASVTYLEYARPLHLCACIAAAIQDPMTQGLGVSSLRF